MIRTCPECGIKRELVPVQQLVAEDRVLTYKTAYMCTKCKGRYEARKARQAWPEERENPSPHLAFLSNFMDLML